MSSEISEFGYGLNLIANTGAQASVRNSDSWPGRGSSSASLCGLRRVMITVRIALMVMTATVMYPVPGGVSAGRGYLATSAAPKPPPTGASFGDFGRRERDLLRGGAKKLARSTVVELAVIRYGRTAV